MNQEKTVGRYKETISDMNDAWKVLLDALQVRDYRVEYLHKFEKTLALNLDTPLWENPRYLRVTFAKPLAEHGYTSYSKFDTYMKLYEYIMRDAGLLSRKVEGGFSGDAGFDFLE